MNKSTFLIITLGLCATIVGYLLVLTVQQQFQAPSLTEADITKKVEQLYRGTAESVVKQGAHYVVSFKREDGVYEVSIDGKSGHIDTLSKVIAFEDKTTEQTTTADDNATSSTSPEPELPADDTTEANEPTENTADTASPTNPPSTTNSNTNTGATTPPTANTGGTTTTPPLPKTQIYITSKQAQEIALKQLAGEVDDLEYVRTSDGGYFLIDIESEDTDATFQIHAVTGKVLSVSYDD